MPIGEYLANFDLEASLRRPAQHHAHVMVRYGFEFWCDVLLVMRFSALSGTQEQEEEQ